MTDVDLNEAGDLVTSDGTTVTAARGFPWSHPDRMIVLRDGDGNEVTCIDDLTKLPARSRGAIEAWLQRHTFVPRILRVNAVKSANAVTLFEVSTDRGNHRVLLREREDLRALADGRTLIRDADGQIFELPPPDELDAHSRRELSQIV